MKKLGIDAGAGNIRAVLFEDSLDNIKVISRRVEGQPIKKTIEVIDEICADEEYEVGITGVNGRAVSELSDVRFVLDPVSVLKGMEKLHPDVRTVFDIGKENSSYLSFNRENGKLVLEDFSTNPVCGAGGGALIEKMAPRLQFGNLDEFVETAYNAQSISNISARCAVFAESDVVHHFQRGSHVDGIAAGLCQVLARNFANNICRDKRLVEPIYMLGGVGINRAVVKYLEEKIGHKLIIPKNSLEIKAIGAALDSDSRISKEEMIDKLSSYKQKTTFGIKPLILKIQKELPYKVLAEENGNKVLLSLNENYIFGNNRECFLGLDVGSVSTKAALIDSRGEFILGIYERTGGKPIDAVVDVIKRIGYLEINGRKIKDITKVLNSGVTGSGRGVAAEIIGAGIVKNEITAQAKGAIYFFPDVDTVFEIGGQDSKYIFIDRGRVIDNEMNKVCAASTGSFLEEQAKILGINIEREFEINAFKSRNPCSLAEKCAVIMESSLLAFQNSPLEDKLAGLAYSICLNYLNRVVGKKRIGDKIVFQGAVAFNKAVSSGFETLLGKQIYVPKYSHLTGAIGIAKIAGESYG